VTESNLDVKALFQGGESRSCLLAPARIAGRCTYKCIDTCKKSPYAVVVAARLCDLSGMNRKTGKTFASTMFALKRPCSFR